MGGTDRAGPGANGRFVRGCRVERESQNEKRPESSPPAAKLREDPCPSGLRREPALSPRKNGPQGEPNSCFQAPLCLLPTHPENAHIFRGPTWGAQNNGGNIRAFSHLAVPGSPCSAPGSPGARPAQTPTLTKALGALVRVEPPHRLWAPPISTKATDPFPAKLSPLPHHPWAGSPGALSSRSPQQVSLQLPLQPTFSRLSALT